MSGTDNTRPYHVQAADPLVMRVRERGIHGMREAEPVLEPLFYGGCNGDPFTKRERKAANRKSRAEGRKLSRDALSAPPPLTPTKGPPMQDKTDIDFLEDPLPESPPIRLSPAAMRQLEAELDRTDDTPPAALVDLIRRRPVWAAR